MFNENTPIEKVNHPDLLNLDIDLWIKRDDLIHPEVSGNKWRKLKEHVKLIQEGKKDGLLTFGGAYSNHIAATAAAGKLLGFPAYGIIRGEELTPASNATLRQAQADGMELIFVSREEYQYKADFDYRKQIKLEYGNVEIVGEGGRGFLGMCGCQQISQAHPEFDVFALACGTGTTMAGTLIGAKSHQKVVGFPVLKGGFIQEEVEMLLGMYFLDQNMHLEYEDQYEVIDGYHFGGYAKIDDQLIEFIQSFYEHTGIKLDPIYTGKMMFGLFDQLKNKKKFQGQKVLAIHTGGLQGVPGIEDRYGVRIFD